MAGYNEIGVARYNRIFQKLFQMKGGSPVPTLGGDIQPSFQVFNGAENRYLETWQRFGYVSQPAAQAAVAAASRLRNPPGSNIIAVLERLVFMNSAGAVDFPILQGQQSTADLSIIAHSPAERWDPRGQQASALIRSESQGVPAPAFFARMQGACPVNSFFDFITDSIHEFPLLPGDAIQMQSNILNTAPIFSFLWRERFLEESERA